MIHPLTQVFLAILLSESNASTSSTGPVCSGSTDVDLFYMDYVSSSQYVEHIQSLMIGPGTLSVLSHVFDISPPAPASSVAYVGLSATVDKHLLASTIGIPPNVTIDDTPISGDDYISSEEVFARLDSIIKGFDQLMELVDLSPANETSPDWFDHDLTRSINLELYYLHIDVSQQSRCSSFQCHAWRILLAQTHYQCAQWVLVGDSIATISEFIRTMLGYMEPLRMQSGRCSTWLPHHPSVVDGKTKSFAPLVILIPIVVEVGCWCIGRCIKYYLDHRKAAATATTTTAPTSSVLSIPPPTSTPIDPRIATTIASVTATIDSWFTQIQSLELFDASVWNFIRNLAKNQIIAISKSLISVGADSGPLITITFDLFRLFGVECTSQDEWTPIRTAVLENLAFIRDDIIADI